MTTDRLRNSSQAKESMKDTLSSSHGHHEHEDPVGFLIRVSEAGSGRLGLLLRHTSISSGAS
jgi:hypothetical protein